MRATYAGFAPLRAVARHVARHIALGLAFLLLPVTLLGVCWLCLTGDDR